MESLSFFGSFVQKVKVSCFSDSFVQKTTQQKRIFSGRELAFGRQDGSCDVTSDSSFYTTYSKNSLFISANTYEKFIVSKEYCIARHDDTMCFLPNCRYHIILIGNIKYLQQKMDAFCCNYQHVDCLYTLFKYRSNGKIVIKSGQLFDNLQKAVHFKTEEWTECPASRRRDS